MIDFELLNSLIKVWLGVGVFIILFISVLGVVIGFYYLMKISKLDDDNFKKRVKAALDECSTNSKKGN